jgi:hypothetical protein
VILAVSLHILVFETRLALAGMAILATGYRSSCGRRLSGGTSQMTGETAAPGAGEAQGIAQLRHPNLGSTPEPGTTTFKRAVPGRIVPS